MSIATDEQVARFALTVKESEARPLKDRLRDPGSHRPGQLRLDALGRIEELEMELIIAQMRIDELSALLSEVHPHHPQPEICPACKALGRV